MSTHSPAPQHQTRTRWRPRFSGPLLARRAGEREAILLTLVCALDMYTTLWWVLTGRAIEANPLLAWTFARDPLTFVLVKSGSCLPALVLAPRLGRRHPRFATLLLRGVLAAYVLIYLGAVR